jgi:hypothetical protein
MAPIGIPLVLGRGFRKADEVNGAHAAIVSEKLALDCWRGQDPLGHRIEIGEEDLPRFVVAGDTPGHSPKVSGKTEVFEVVGVGRNVRDGLAIAAKEAPAAIYLPMLPEECARPARNGLTLTERAALMFPVKVALYSYGSIGFFGLILAAAGLGV